jgi:hypothetical protein
MSRFRRGVEQLLRAKLHRQNLTPQLQVRIDELAAKQAKAREAKNTQKRSSAEIGVMSLIPPVMAQPANRPHPSAGPALRLRRVLAAITAPGPRGHYGAGFPFVLRTFSSSGPSRSRLGRALRARNEGVRAVCTVRWLRGLSRRRC